MDKPLHYRDAPEHRDIRTDEPRVLIGAHWGKRDGSPPAYVMPAIEAQIGMMALENDQSVYHPTLTMYAHGANIALSFLATADELDALAASMLKIAEHVRAEAAGVANAAIERARQGGAA